MRETIAEKVRSVSPRNLGFIAAGHGSGEPVGRHADEIVRGGARTIPALIVDAGVLQRR
jgi:hypothetical protein